MLNLKQIKSDGEFIEARVEPWSPQDLSFDIRVDLKTKNIVVCSISDNTSEYRIYAKKARNKLCDMVDESKKNNTPLPYYGYYVTY